MDDYERQIQFTQRFSECERAMRAFALSLIPNRDDVDDVIQETLKELWRKFDEFDPGRPFLSWANRFVYRQVLIHRRSTAIRLKYMFSDELLQYMVNEQPPLEPDVALSDALDNCLQLLADDQRELVRLRYFTGISLKEVAQKLGKSPAAIYKQIQRIRHAIQKCVTRRLAQGG